METYLSEEHEDDGHYHSTSENGLVWFLLNEMLHLLVLVYTLFGMIKFKVKFIHMVKLVNWISFCVITFNWYLAVKFASIASLMYFSTLQLGSAKLSLTQFNCSLSNDRLVFEGRIKQLTMATTHSHHSLLTANQASSSSEGLVSSSLSPSSSSFSASVQSDHYDTDYSDADDELHMSKRDINLHQNLTLIDYLTSPYYPLLLTRLLDNIGGPYKFLGNRAALMYGFYAIAIYIMLAIFPIELSYHDIGFNYIRFVLNDSSCLRAFYQQKRRHLERLNNWSRNKNTSMLTLSTKKVINQRNLRCLYVYDCERFAEQTIGGHLMATSKLGTRPLEFTSNCQLVVTDTEFVTSANSDTIATTATSVATANRLTKRRNQLIKRREQEPGKLNSSAGAEFNGMPLKSLRHSLSTNHHDQPSYNVKVANKNLKKFKPHVRGECWLKLSMVVYPVFAFYYFCSLTITIGAISVFITDNLRQISENCARSIDKNIDLIKDWNFYDSLTFFETQYAVFALSFASSFFCSYYFGTITELLVWIGELAQQLDLCRLVLQLTYEAPQALCAPPSSRNCEFHLCTPSTVLKQQTNTKKKFKINTSGSSSLSLEEDEPNQILENYFLEALSAYHNLDKVDEINQYYNQFGGLKSIWSHLKFNFASQSNRLKRRELMAIKLISKKQTLLRATYINMNLYFDELNGTRFMTKTILGRTTQLAFGFALMVSITKSQFESDYMSINVLLASCLAILNLYLICAASINGGINKLLPLIHAVVSASIVAGTDHDLLEFWLRHIQAYGTDKDAMSYKIYGYKVTWSSILKFNGAVSSAYLFTVY